MMIRLLQLNDIEMNDQADFEIQRNFFNVETYLQTCRWYNRDLSTFNESTLDKDLQHNLNNQPSADTNNNKLQH